MSSLTELQNIRNKFQFDLREWFNKAHSFVAITSLGIDIVQDEINTHNSFYSFAVPISTSLGESLAEISKLQYSEMFAIYLTHKEVITELFYGRIIQLWYDFLNQIIEQLVRVSFIDSSKYPKLHEKISFIKTIDENIKIIRRNFDNSSGVDKIDKVEEYLGQKIDENLRQLIKVAITVRNLLEHNQGVIRDRDLNVLNITAIELINESCQEQDYFIDQKVRISIYEVYRLKNIFYHTSNQLIPN
ncbi:hypothetical protein BV378_10270 [Nostoc sp. RF31YmG]|nr:hypothetical protein BV378_10270 [Nostoc sp. RF31YmG]